MGFVAPIQPSVTAAAIEGAFLERGMEARALNLEQYDPSPGIDSQLERIRALARRFPPSRLREALIAEVECAIDSNCFEGAELLSINGAADHLVADLRRIERQPGRRTLGAKAIARALREPLALTLCPAGSTVTDLVEARRHLKEAIEGVPRLMLLSGAVAHELGREKFAALERLCQEDGAAQSLAAGAVEDRGSGRHAEL